MQYFAPSLGVHASAAPCQRHRRQRRGRERAEAAAVAEGQHVARGRDEVEPVRGPRPVPEREAVAVRQHHAEEDRVRQADQGQRRQDLRPAGHHGHEVCAGEDLLGHVEGLAGRARGPHGQAPARSGDRVGAVVEHAGGAVPRSRTQMGINTNGAANFDRLGKKVRPGTFGR